MTPRQVIINIKEVSSKSCLKVESYRGGSYLRPAKACMADAEKMAGWRSGAFNSFLTWIKPTAADMLAWLKEYEKNSHDIIFILETKEYGPIGQMSIYNIDFKNRRAEFGRMIRGVKEASRGAMAMAAKTLLRWAFHKLGTKEVILQVFADNHRAISLYNRLGFKVTDTVSYRRTCDDKRVIKWIPSDKIEASLSSDRHRKVHDMSLNKKVLCKIKC